MDRITIRAFRAIDSKEDTIRYIYEHTRVLEDIGVTSALKADFTWCKDPESVVIVAEHETLGMVGGCRIQFGKTLSDLPFHQHLKGLVPDAELRLFSSGTERLFELAGLWVARRYARQGLPWYLTSAAVALFDVVKADRVFCFAAEYSMSYAMRNGFALEDRIGSSGMVEFPLPGIRSCLLTCDGNVLSRTTGAEHDRLQSLRRSPNQVRSERNRESALLVTYSLLIRERTMPYITDLGYNTRIGRRSA